MNLHEVDSIFLPYVVYKKPSKPVPHFSTKLVVNKTTYTRLGREGE